MSSLPYSCFILLFLFLFQLFCKNKRFCPTDFRLRSSLLRCPQRRRQRNYRCSIVFIWSTHSIGAINSQGSLPGDSGRLATTFTIHLYYQQTTHSSNMRLILNLDYSSAPGHPRLRPQLLPAINPSFLHLIPIPMSHGSTPLTHGGNADEEREGRRSIAAGYHADRHDGSTTPSCDTT